MCQVLKPCLILICRNQPPLHVLGTSFYPLSVFTCICFIWMSIFWCFVSLFFHLWEIFINSSSILIESLPCREMFVGMLRDKSNKRWTGFPKTLLSLGYPFDVHIKSRFNYLGFRVLPNRFHSSPQLSVPGVDNAVNLSFRLSFLLNFWLLPTLFNSWSPSLIALPS